MRNLCELKVNVPFFFGTDSGPRGAMSSFMRWQSLLLMAIIMSDTFPGCDPKSWKLRSKGGIQNSTCSRKRKQKYFCQVSPSWPSQWRLIPNSVYQRTENESTKDPMWKIIHRSINHSQVRSSKLNLMFSIKKGRGSQWRSCFPQNHFLVRTHFYTPNKNPFLTLFMLCDLSLSGKILLILLL